MQGMRERADCRECVIVLRPGERTARYRRLHGIAAAPPGLRYDVG
jgi:hypothetical protein